MPSNIVRLTHRAGRIGLLGERSRSWKPITGLDTPPAIFRLPTSGRQQISMRKESTSQTATLILMPWIISLAVQRYFLAWLSSIAR